MENDIMIPLFAKDLYLNEDEYNLFCVMVPLNFFQCKNIELEYHRKFEEKIEESIKKYFKAFFDEEYGTDELLNIISENLGKDDLKENVVILLDKSTKHFRKKISELLNTYIFDESYTIYGLDDGVPTHYAKEICENNRVTSLIRQFTARLKHYQTGGTLKELYQKLNYDADETINVDKSWNFEIDFEELINLIHEEAEN